MSIPAKRYKVLLSHDVISVYWWFYLHAYSCVNGSLSYVCSIVVALWLPFDVENLGAIILSWFCFYLMSNGMFTCSESKGFNCFCSKNLPREMVRQ